MSSTSSERTDPLAPLLVAAAAGDHDAFASLYDAVAPRVLGVALRILRDRQQSEEVSHEALLQVWQTASRFDPAKGSAMAWVLTTTHRRAVDRVRSSESSRRRDLAHAHSNVDVPFDTTSTEVLASVEAARVRRAMEQLTPIQAEAIRLAYFGGYTHTEVSRLLRIPVGTAKTRIRDGLIKLRDLLAVQATAEIA